VVASPPACAAAAARFHGQAPLQGPRLVSSLRKRNSRLCPFDPTSEEIIMGRRILNRKDLRADFDAGERRKDDEDEKGEEDEEKDEEEEEEGEKADRDEEEDGEAAEAEGEGEDDEEE